MAIQSAPITTTLTVADVERIKQPDRSYTQDYAELKRRVKERGLMQRQPRYYTYALIEPVVLLAISIAILLLVDNFWVQLGNIVLMSLAYVRTGFIMHDAGHRQIATTPRRNDLVGLVFGDLLLGSSNSAWREKHNEHHAHTNEIGADPDLEIPVWAWIEEQAKANKGWVRWMMTHQAYTFFPVLMLTGFFQAVAAQRVIIHPR
jgi:fatty acid desaturase